MDLAAIWHVSTQYCPQSNEAILPNDTKNDTVPDCQSRCQWLLSSQSLSQFLTFTHNFTQLPETLLLAAFHIVPKSAFKLSGVGSSQYDDHRPT